MDLETLILSANERQALKRFVTYLQTSQADRIESISLFGSKARGDSQPDSDIDILIIVHEDDDEVQWDISTEAARISLEFDLILSPRVIGLPRWEEMRGFTLYRNVVQDAAGLDVEDGELVFEPAGIA